MERWVVRVNEKKVAYFCPVCNASISKDTVKCPFCGTLFSTVIETSITYTSPLPPSQPPARIVFPRGFTKKLEQYLLGIATIVIILIPAIALPIYYMNQDQTGDTGGDDLPSVPTRSYLNITANNSIIWNGLTHTGSYTDTLIRDNVNELFAGWTDYADILVYFFWWKPEYYRVKQVYLYGNMTIYLGYSRPETFIEGSAIHFSENPGPLWRSHVDYFPSSTSNFSISFELAYPVVQINVDMIVVTIELQSS